MANINRYEKLGRIWVKNYFSGVLDGSDSDSGAEMTVFAKVFPAMTMPHRMWLSWNIYSNPEDDVLPHVQNEMVMSFRAANIANNDAGSGWDTPTNIHNKVDEHLQTADAQLTSESADADDIGMYGGFVRTTQGKSHEIFERPKKYMLGLPNHAMLTKSNNIMMHCVGHVNSDRNVLRIPKVVDIERPFFVALTVARQQPASGTGNDQAMHDTEENSIVGAQRPDQLYDSLLDAIPKPVSTNSDYTISTDDLNSAVKDWQTTGYSQGTYAGSDMPDLHYAIKFTAETSIYGPRNSNTILAP